MTLLFDLPFDLYNDVCSCWLLTNDMGKLDISISQSSYRESLLKQLLERTMEYDIDNKSVAYYNWMYARDIPIKSLSLNRNLFDKGMFQCNVKFQQVQTLYASIIPKICSNSLYEVMNACTHLSELHWNTFQDLGPCVKIKGLTSLILVVPRANYQEIFVWIATHCTKLQNLQVYGTKVMHEVEYDPKLLSLMDKAIQMNSSTLRYLRLHSSCGVPSEVYNCPHMEDLTIKSNIEWQESDVSIRKLSTMNFEISTVLDSLEYNKFKSLLSIFISDIKEDFICEVMCCLEGIKILSIRGGATIGDNLFNCIVDHLAHSLTRLSFLMIHCPSAQSIRHLLFSCKKLESFDIEYVQMLLSPSEICNIIIDVKPPKLQQLAMSIEGVRNELLIELLISVPSFKKLTFKHAYDVNFNLLSEFITSEQNRGRDLYVNFI